MTLRGNTRRFLTLSLAGLLLSSCNKPASQTSGGSKATTNSPASSTEVLTASSLTFEPLTNSTVYTSDAGSNNCLSFSVKALTSAKTPATGASINISLLGVPQEEAKDWGIISTPIIVAADGLAKGSFCAAAKIGKKTLIAESNNVKANSGEVSITPKPYYTFEFRNSDFDKSSSKPQEILNLNLFDSGPNDCGNLYFQLRKLNNPVPGVSIVFRSDFGYPAGAKLRSKASTDTPYETDPTTGQKFLSYRATSDNDGIFSIPVCSGPLPGAFFVFANYTDEYGKNSYSKSPTLTVKSGVANLSTLALKFNEKNARTLKALFNSETPTPIEFIAKIGSVFGGALSILNPLYLNSESGSFPDGNVGAPDDTGSVKFSMLATYNGTARPTPVHIFEDSAASSTCNPEAIAREVNNYPPVTAGNFKTGYYYKITTPGDTDFTAIGATSNLPNTIFRATGPGSGSGSASLAAFPYSDIAKNWRSTMVYMTRGQETFNDANRNGKYDQGGDGFWDKNQDGAYTKGIDAVTFFGSIPAGSCRCLDSNGQPLASAPAAGVQSTPCIENPLTASCFRLSSEWFIDLPTPFVDANENGIYEPQVAGQDMDRLIGDSYSEPNGRRDVDTMIWKSLVLPIYTGTSQYSLVRSHIKVGSVLTPDSDPDPATETSAVTAYFQNLVDRNLNTYKFDYIPILFHAQKPFIESTMTGDGGAGYWGYRWLMARGICGTPLPGGTKIEGKDEVIWEAYGDRKVAVHFYQQPGDQILDPSRRLLLQGGGTNSTEINFNIPDHPSSAVGYPVEYSLEVAGCTRAVPNGFGVWCSEALRRIDIKVDTDTISTYLRIPEYMSPSPMVCRSGYFANPATGSCEQL